MISEEQIKARLATLAFEINRHYGGKSVIAVGILKGSIMFMADLVRLFNFDVAMDFISVSSYGNGTTSSGVVKINKDLDMDVTGEDVLIIEDIVDSGRTLRYIKNHILDMGARSVKVCTLLDKPEKRVVDIDMDYTGFEIEDKFVVGYGLDYAERYRGLRFIGVME